MSMSSDVVGGSGSRNQIVVIEDESAAPGDEFEDHIISLANKLEYYQNQII